MEYEGVFFWHHTGPYGFLSNWYPAEFTIDGVTYRDTEQYFMAQKAIRFGDTTRLAEIMAAEDPATYKKLGRLVENYDPAVWNAVRYEVMKTGNRAKFAQHPELRQKLLATGDALIAEASPRDCIWGIGYGAERARLTPPDRFRGQNLQGRLLMELREEFRIHAS